MGLRLSVEGLQSSINFKIVVVKSRWWGFNTACTWKPELITCLKMGALSPRYHLHFYGKKACKLFLWRLLGRPAMFKNVPRSQLLPLHLSSKPLMPPDHGGNSAQLRLRHTILPSRLQPWRLGSEGGRRGRGVNTVLTNASSIARTSRSPCCSSRHQTLSSWSQFWQILASRR